MKNILFVSHDASRTGAPIVLLNFIAWLKSNADYNLSVFLMRGGDLEADFKKVATTYVIPQPNLAVRALNKVANKLNTKGIEYKLPQGLPEQKFDLIYLNTIVSLELSQYLKKVFGCPIICHIHENDFTISYHYPGILNDSNIKATDHFIAVSNNTRDNLVHKYHIAPEKVSQVYAFIPVKKLAAPVLSPQVIKDELELTEEFIVGGCGLTTWRKGVDLFIQLAKILSDAHPDKKIKLVWVGSINHEFNCQFNYEADRLGLKEKLIFTGAKVNPENYFQLFDVFALTSREDPFPLVALEAAALQKPILCFENSGGMPEVINDNVTGYVLPYADIAAMAGKIIELMNNEPLRQEMGKNAAKLVAGFDVDVIGKQLLQVMEQVINN